MPTMRRSTRTKSAGGQSHQPAAAAAEPTSSALATPTRSSRRVGTNGNNRGEAVKLEAADWSGVSSPLSSLSTPVVAARLVSSSPSASSSRKAQQKLASDEESGGGSGAEDDGSGGVDSVHELLSKAAEAIREEAYESDEGDEDARQAALSEARASKRQRNNTHGNKAAQAWYPGKRGRPPKSATKRPMGGHSEADDAEDFDEDDISDDDVSDTDEAGEAKIDRNGHLQGGREFICPVFQSPFRANRQRLFVLSMDCCRFTGARDSYMLFKQHPRMRRIETTQQERDLLAERLMIPRVTRFRSIGMITARAAFREFGARLVKDGRYVVDDYWEAARRQDAKFPEGAMVANMSVYRSVLAAHAAGVTPGSTRVARRSTPLRSPATADEPPTPAPQASSWVQLEAQQRHHPRPVAQPARTARTMASALLAPPPPAPSLVPHLALQMPASMAQFAMTSAAGDATEPNDMAPLAKPVFRRMRARETADAAFGSAAAAHRAHFDDSGFVDGPPLAHSLAAAWARAPPSLANRLKQRLDGSATADDGAGAFGPMAFASAKAARDFNASVRMWRDDNGCTWVDPHTAVRQVPASLQPTSARAELVASARSNGTRIDARVAFAEETAPAAHDTPGAESHPLALLPGQFQQSFPIHRTRFGQSYQSAMQSYSYHWLRQLVLQQPHHSHHQQQQQQQQHQHQQQQRRAQAVVRKR
ncbi:hypothetical protein EV174_001037 [Coemansia sp. RSA 2320]|nr:hypothetical protein EV174_001037 [Coemansia sp. RSA 2320]